jgi:hypothetical protein
VTFRTPNGHVAALYFPDIERPQDLKPPKITINVMTMIYGSLAVSDDIVIRGEARQIKHEIIEYLERHQHDLPPEVRIILERQFLGPSS